MFSRLLHEELSIEMPPQEGWVTIDLTEQPISAMLDEICSDLDRNWDLDGERPVTSRIAAVGS